MLALIFFIVLFGQFQWDFDVDFSVDETENKQIEGQTIISREKNLQPSSNKKKRPKKQTSGYHDWNSSFFQIFCK